ncbi:MAG: hypothetical protein CMK07_13545 [Ponticaulis sp.]|nr:hypothetical protein [Ponticaulis sp.]|tara:strand:+ start:5208 stop:5963 length:756 start_codon:yes stop_codon:yes gene_type:complete
MNIFDLFNKGQQAQQQPAPQQQQQPAAAAPGNLPADAGDVNNGNEGGEPNGTVPPAATDEGKSDDPLDTFKDLWENSSNEPNELKLTEFSKEDLIKAAQKVNFSDSLNQDLIKQVAAGGEEAVSAMSQLLNTFGQQLLAHSAGVSSQLSKRNITEAVGGVNPKIEQAIRNYTSQNDLSASHKQLQHPSVKPVADAVRQQLLSKYPDASPNEISDMTVNYLEQMGTITKPAPTPAPTSENLDWDSWIESGSN